MKYKHLGIYIDPTRTDTMAEFSKDLVLGFYSKEGESIQETFARACVAWADDEEHAQRLYDGCSQGHFMWSSPALANAPLPGETPIGQPISCFLPAISDNIPSLLMGKLELSILSVLGGGLGQFYDVRYASSKSPGPIPFIHEADASILAWKQGKTRRGALAAWMRADHPSSVEFMNIRTPTGDINRKAENIHQGYSIPDKMMESIEQGVETFDLVDPHTKEVVQQINPLSHFMNMLTVRGRTGEPFLYFVDTANKHLPESQKRLGLKSHASNLCFGGETFVAVADGRAPMHIEKLARQSNGSQKFKVWSAKFINGKSHPEIRDATAQLTGYKQLVKVVMSNGDSFRCTHDHELFTENGHKVKAHNAEGLYLDSHRLVHGGFVPNPTRMRVDKIIFTKDVEPVYCLTVDENHNFYICTDDKPHDKYDRRMVLVSNCTEITLPANEERTPVCCLASLNAEKRDEWAPTLVRDIIRALDNIITHFVETVDHIKYRYPEEHRELISLALRKVKYAASRERSLGLGMMGYHYALQQRGLAFEDPEAAEFNKQLFTYVKEEALAETYQLGMELGVAPDAEGDDHSHSGRRNMHLLAIAPNSNNSDMLATSAACEPMYANIFTKESRIGLFEVKNRYLERLLKELGQDTEETWNQIAADEGSVKNLTFLTDHQKKVYYTAFEINQLDLVRHAADRQPKICQAQSLNLFFKPGTDVNYVFTVHFMAWKWGLKSVYYYRTEPEVKVARLADVIEEKRLKDAETVVPKNIIYGTAQCPNCKIAKRLFEELDMPYEYVDLQAEGKTAAEVTGDPGIRTVPQIFIADKWIGGINELRAFHQTTYREMLESAQIYTSSDDGACLNCEG